jgi:hypothetical protein
MVDGNGLCDDDGGGDEKAVVMPICCDMPALALRYNQGLANQIERKKRSGSALGPLPRRAALAVQSLWIFRTVSKSGQQDNFIAG